MTRNLTFKATVAPAKAGAGLFFSNISARGEVAEGSQAPDQVRGDEFVKRWVGA